MYLYLRHFIASISCRSKMFSPSREVPGGSALAIPRFGARRVDDRDVRAAQEVGGRLVGALLAQRENLGLAALLDLVDAYDGMHRDTSDFHTAEFASYLLLGGIEDDVGFSAPDKAGDLDEAEKVGLLDAITIDLEGFVLGSEADPVEKFFCRHGSDTRSRLGRTQLFHRPGI